MISQEQIDAMNALVVGFMDPVFRRVDPVTGEILNGLGPSDFARVKAGYGCPKCCAKFKTYLVTCPTINCGFVRNIEEDVVAPPQDWVDHLAERNEAWADSKPVSTDEFIKSVMADRDIDHIKL